MTYFDPNSYTRPMIDTSHTSLRGRHVTVKLLEDKLDEINFVQDSTKEDFSQKLEDIVETTHARLRMQQGCIRHLKKRMHLSNVDKEIIKKPVDQRR